MNLTTKLGLSIFSLLAASLVACAAPADDAASAKSDSDLTAPRPAPRHCGGFAGFQCGADEFCEYAPNEMCGAADHLGTCKSRPQICLEYYAPVCGCDGKTYGNDCDANRAGVGVFSQGACAPSPIVCTADYDPVCGADGKTYSNECTARAAGTTVAAQGECVASERSCGGRLGADACAANEYCEYKPEDRCGAADHLGTCRARPELCTYEYEPVCGCDGKTYSNVCSAGSAGVAVARHGACN